MSKIRCYSDLQQLLSFEERFNYLALKDRVGERTFGFDRWINQEFYHSREWQRARDAVIVRDYGCDLGIRGYEIKVGLLIHHMNPMSERDIIHGETWILNPEFLITTTKATHNAIHYGDSNSLRRPFAERTANDTKLW
jgi:hypothetical protein